MIMEVISCKLCNRKNVPMKMTNLFIDSRYNVYGVCSQCILKTPPDKLFPDGPVPWHERFYNSVKETPRSETLSILAIALMVSIMLWFIVRAGGV